jgi:undecaprenyl-diphosphatase
MDFLTAIIAGFLQGIFEWLPISSQGNILGIFTILGSDPKLALQLAVMLHAGTLISAIVYFRKEIKEMMLTKTSEDKKMLKFIFIATFATAITAIPSFLILEEFLGTGVAFVLLLLAILLIITGILQLTKKKVGNGELTIKNAILAGLGQGFAVLPGVSRSGTTTSVLLFRGFTPQDAFKISFIMSIPAVLLAEIGYGLIKGFLFDNYALLALFIAFVVGLVSMDLLIKAARKINFAYFCFLLAAIYFIGFIFLL